MVSKAIKSLVLCAALAVSGLELQAQLLAGAGRAEITPDANLLPKPFIAVHDALYTRAILLKNAGQSAILMNLDTGGIPRAFYEEISQEIAKRYQVPIENIVISATHDHASVLAWDNLQPEQGEGTAITPLMGAAPKLTPELRAFTAKVHKAMLAALDQAQAALQPAEMGFGEGQLYLNVNRDAIDPKSRQWVEGSNPDFPSDKTLAVLVFRRQQDGAPIAFYMNYNMHAVTMFLRNELSGDFPGVTQRYIEDNYDGKAVAIWSTGAAGDQNPLYRRAISKIGAATIQNEMKSADPSEYGGALFRLMFSVSEKPTHLPEAKAAEQSWQVVQGMGTLMAEEALRVADNIQSFSRQAEIRGALQVIECPGRTQTDKVFMGAEAHYMDGPPVHIALGALRIGTVAIGRSNSELYTKIGQEIKAGSPLRSTLVVTLAGGKPEAEYIPSDDAYGRYSFEVIGTPLKPGCAETSIVKSIDTMIEKALF